MVLLNFGELTVLDDDVSCELVGFRIWSCNYCSFSLIWNLRKSFVNILGSTLGLALKFCYIIWGYYLKIF